MEFIFGNNQGDVLKTKSPVSNSNNVGHGENGLEEQVSLVSIRQASSSGLFAQHIENVLVKSYNVVNVDRKQGDDSELDSIINIGFLVVASKRPVDHIVGNG